LCVILKRPCDEDDPPKSKNERVSPSTPSPKETIPNMDDRAL
jgi:hypothetical protein